MAGDIFLRHAASVIRGRHERNPHLLHNAARLRELKGEERWTKDHQPRRFNAPRLNHETPEHHHRTEFSRGSEVGCRVDVRLRFL
ncbi:hypothetical protein EHI47_07215 [Rhizobium leguminosarum]|uniref:Uncharacterized protein n=1 Tax=Rhizobium leguminosarum TaxID=384 RepID=A0A444I734_RHILE|nr:hypothetical protein EHI47_07215 [Rhizobium leguminosarum]